MAPAHGPDAGGHLRELETPPRKKLVAIDWPAVHVGSQAEAMAIWNQIAPTGDDWEARLSEVPADGPIARELAIALLHDGNFTCVAPVVAGDCIKAPVDVDPPAPTATLADPCLRRVLAMWSIDQLEEDDLARAKDALRALAAIPPPESQLVAAAIKAIPEAAQDDKLELLGLAWRAGQHELVNGLLASLDEAHLIAAAKLHIDAAVDVLAAESHRAVYLAAAIDEHMASAPRAQAIAELATVDATLPADLRKTLYQAASSPDCDVAAAAARALDQKGDPHFLPKRPHATREALMMRAMCVLASYERLQHADEPSLLASYLPPRGLELIKITDDPYNEVDNDGDGDPHTVRTIDLIARAEALLPELDDLVRALHHCKGTICSSDDREFRFTFKPGAGGDLVLWRLEMADRPPCSNKQAIPVR